VKITKKRLDISRKCGKLYVLSEIEIKKTVRLKMLLEISRVGGARSFSSPDFSAAAALDFTAAIERQKKGKDEKRRL
jgi:hypothetical protein